MKQLKVSNETRNQSLASRVWLADGYWTRLRGLLGRPKLADGEGLLIAPSRGVHMYGMRYALDVVLLDGSRRVVALYRGLKPGSRTKVHREASFALELPVGTIERSATEEGDVLEWELAEKRAAVSESRVP